MLRLGCLGCLTIIVLVALVGVTGWGIVQAMRAPDIALGPTSAADGARAQQKIFELLRRARGGRPHTVSLPEREVNAFLSRHLAEAADRWLFVEKAKDAAPGGWATGSFDQQKNKLDIHTRDVRQFVIDVSRIRIDWQRLVVLSIDGKNSELRRRDFSLLHFRLDDHGQWVVVEP